MGVPVADQRILGGTSSVVSWQNLDGDGNAAAPAGAVTVGIVNAAGTEVIPAGTATDGSGAAPRTFTLTPDHNETLDLLTVTWTDGTSTSTTLVEVVGGYYFTVAEARAADPAMRDDQKFSTADIIDARRAVEEEFEQICAVAFVPRYRRERVTPNYCQNTVLLDQPQIRNIRSITSYDTAGVGTSWTGDQLEQVISINEGVRITSRAWQSFIGGDTVIEYEHGYDRPPTEVKRAALQRLRYLVAKPNSGIPDRAQSFSVSDGGTYGLVRASAYSTGNDDIDAVLGRWSLRIPGVA